MIKNKTWKQNDGKIICSNNKIRNNWLYSGEADIIPLDMSFSPAQTWQRTKEPLSSRHVWTFCAVCNSSTLISAWWWHCCETSRAFILQSSVFCPVLRERALKANFVLRRHFSFPRRGLFQLSACFTDYHLLIPPQRWEQQMWNGHARW